MARPATITISLVFMVSCGANNDTRDIPLPNWLLDSGAEVLTDASEGDNAVTDPGPDACIPDCADRDCGDDGCGGTCGSCFGDLVCNWDTGICEAACTDPFEPDDDPSNDNDLTPDVQQEHTICPDTDQDWFAITLDIPSAVSVKITTSKQASIDVYLLDQDKTEIDSTSTMGGSGLVQAAKLPAGTYFLKAKSGDDTETNPRYWVVFERACAPDCAGVQCGDDGCGGICDSCPDGFECKPDEGCVSGCKDPFEPDNDPELSTLLLPDTPATQSLCPSDDKDWFSFDLDMQSDIQIWVTTQAQWKVDVMLFDTDMVELDSAISDTGYANINADALAAGRYFLLIKATDGDIQIPAYKVQYGFKCAPMCDGKECGDDGCGGTCGSCGDFLECGEEGLCLSSCIDSVDQAGSDDDEAHAGFLAIQDSTDSHSICPADDVDWFRFSLPWTLADVTIETFGAMGNTEMWLYDADLTEIDSDDDSGVGQFSKITVPDIPGGSYYVRLKAVDDLAQVPQYTISLKAACSPSCQGRVCGTDGCSPGSACGTCAFGYVCTAEGQCVSGCVDQVDKTKPDNESASANLIFDGETISTHSICPGDDVDWYVFTVTQKPDVDVVVETLSANLDVWLYDSGLVELDSNTTKPSGKAKLHVGALAEGIYYVKVAAGEDSQVPVYTITLDQN
ncbi:MAG: hypothetical protein GXP54_00045 [Deltaproteobacteria bacterium]|nr:hypothetical protein [Deltaproteobacteria bacterium]